MNKVEGYSVRGHGARHWPLLLWPVILVCLLMGGCRKQAVFNSGSPVPIHYSMAVSNHGTESSQKVEVSVFFNKSILVSNQAADDFKLLLDGQPIDSKTMDYHVLGSSKDHRALLIAIEARPTVSSPGKGKFFALYNGKLSIESVNPKGIAGVTDQAGRVSAKWQKINCLIPSGLALKTALQQKGDLRDQLKAKTIVEIRDIPKIRVISWIQLLKNGSPVMPKGSETDAYANIDQRSFPASEGFFPLHDHQFMIMTKEDYAGELAGQLQHFFGGTGQYTFSHQDGQVIIQANQVKDGELLQLNLCGSDSAGRRIS